MKPNRAITSTNTHIDGRIHTQKQPQLQSYATSSIKSGTTSLGRQRISTGLGASSSLSGNSIASRHTQAKTTIASQKVIGEDTQRLQSITNPPLTRTNRIISDDSPTQEYIKDKGIETLKLPRIYLRVVPSRDEDESPVHQHSTDVKQRPAARTQLTFPGNFLGQHGVIRSIRYSKSRGMMVASVRYNNGETAIIPSTTGMKPGDTIYADRHGTELRDGNSTSIRHIPVGQVISFIEPRTGMRPKIATTPGSFAQVILKEESERSSYAVLRLHTGEFRVVGLGCLATIGAVSLPRFGFTHISKRPSASSFMSVKSYLLSPKSKNSLIAEPAKHPRLLNSFRSTVIGSYLYNMFKHRGSNIAKRRPLQITIRPMIPATI